jgi:hypothetical protein
MRTYSLIRDRASLRRSAAATEAVTHVLQTLYMRSSLHSVKLSAPHLLVWSSNPSILTQFRGLDWPVLRGLAQESTSDCHQLR